MPTATPKPVKLSDKPRDMLRFDLDNENETIRNYRERIRQCEDLGEFAMAEQIREISSKSRITRSTLPPLSARTCRT